MRKIRFVTGIAMLALMSAGAWAQVQVNDKEWAGLSTTEQQKITDILTASKLLSAGEQITPSGAARPSSEVVAAAAGTPETAVEVNAAEWNSLTPQERNQITEIMKGSKLIQADQAITPSERALPSLERLAQAAGVPAPTAGGPTPTTGGALQCFARDAQGRTQVIVCPPGLEPQLFGIPGFICRPGCDAAAAIAGAACATLTGPAIPVCLAAAEAGRRLCRSRC
jgi:hypothetical protein